MSNRIDEIILAKFGGWGLPPAIINQIEGAMVQYGEECGIIEGKRAVDEAIPQIIRLRELVKAQKEYIHWLQINAKEDLSFEDVGEGFKLKDKIKQLES